MTAVIAYRNFCRQGARAFLNVVVAGASIIAIVFMLSLLNGFQAQGTRNMARTDTAGGHYRPPGFDLLSPTEWEDFTVKIPGVLRALPPGQKAEVLVQQGQIFPGNRLYPVQLRGVESGQKLLDLPLASLAALGPGLGNEVPVILGSKMARKAHLRKGDVVVLKWRDRQGAVDARDARVLEVADLLNPRIDEGVVWLRLDHLRLMTGRADEVSWVAVGAFVGAVEGMEFHSLDDLMADLLNLLRHDRRNSRILWTILMFLAGVSIFNTQILNVFKRQKEIGTLMALGMTPRQVVRLFALEGVYAAAGALLFAVIFGVPFFLWFQGVGFDVSHLSETAIPVQNRIYPDYRPLEIASSAAVVAAVSIIVSWLPARKIAGMDATLALRGKAIT